MLRRIRPIITIGSGAYWIVMAFLLPLVVYPRLAVLPLDPQAKQMLHGTGFNVLVPRSADQGGLKVYRGVGITGIVFVSADPSQGTRPADSPNADWRIATTMRVDGVGLLSTTVEGVSLDRRTALASNCCADYLITDANDSVGVPMPHQGYAAAFPFNVQKQNYQYWDSSIKNTATATFTGEEKRRGLNTYRFDLYVDEQKLGTQALPGQLFGLNTPSVVADSMYHTHRTYWVEPATGAIVDYREAMDRRFVYGGKTVPAIQGTLTMVPDNNDRNFRLTKLGAFGLPLLRHTLPLVFGLLGIGLIAFGLSRLRRDRATQAEAGEAEARHLVRGAGLGL